jgi:hypothetical protein
MDFIPFGKRLRGVTVRDKVLSTTDAQQGLSPTYPRDVMIETRVWRQSLPHCHPAFVPARLRVSEGRQGFKDNVYHVCHPTTPPEFLIVVRLLRSTSEGRSDYPMNPQERKSVSSGQADSPWYPLHGPGRRCVKVCAWRIRWIGEEKKTLQRNRNNGLNRRR